MKLLEHLKENTQKLEIDFIITDISDIAILYPNLRYISFKNNNLDLSYLEDLEYLDTIEINVDLSLKNIPISVLNRIRKIICNKEIKDLEYLKYCKSLQYLSIDIDSIFDTYLLTNCLYLKDLMIYNKNYDRKECLVDLSFIKNLPDLKYVYFENLNIDDISNLRNSNISELNIQNNSKLFEYYPMLDMPLLKEVEIYYIDDLYEDRENELHLNEDNIENFLKELKFKFRKEKIQKIINIENF